MAHDITVDIQEIRNVRYITKVGFAGFDQGPLLTVYREQQNMTTNEVDYAEVLYQYNGKSWDDLLKKR